MSTHKKHHYVPRFLLKHWYSGSDNKLSAFSWQRGKIQHDRYSAKGVAHEEHLYSLQRSLPTPDIRIEKDFMGPKVDDPAAVVHQRILAAGVRSLSDADRQAWATFLVSLLLRSPSMVQNMRARGERALCEALDAEPHEFMSLRGDSPEATLREWVTKHLPDVLDDLGVMALPATIYSEVLNKAMVSGKWTTRHLEKGRFDLLLSDTPLIYLGSFVDSFLLALPLSPQIVFLAFNDDQTLANMKSVSDQAFIREINLTSSARAHKYVYATDQRQRPFVTKYLRKPSGQAVQTDPMK